MDLPVTHVDLMSPAGPIKLSIYRLPSSTGSGRWVVARQLEVALFGSLFKSGNLFNALREMQMLDSLLHPSASSLCGLTEQQLKQIKVDYAAFQQALVPGSVGSKRLSLVPCRIATTLAMSRRNRGLLEALGEAVPEAWIKEDEQAALEDEGLVDLVLDDDLASLQEEEPLDELLEVAIQAELGEYVPFEEEPEQAPQQYALKPNRHLRGQLEAYKEWKTRKLVGARVSAAVQPVTAEGDVSCLLRFMGWLDGNKLDSTAQDIGVVRSARPEWLDEYCTFLLESRGVAFGSVANYLNGLLNVLQHLQATDEQDLEPLIEAAFNLRLQAEKEARTQRLYRERHPEWLDWTEARDTRHNVLRALDEWLEPRFPDRRKTLELVEDALIISLHTVAPPDRVGVVRRLCIDETLKKRESDGVWYIDLCRFRHKTSRCPPLQGAHDPLQVLRSSDDPDQSTGCPAAGAVAGAHQVGVRVRRGRRAGEPHTPTVSLLHANRRDPVLRLECLECSGQGCVQAPLATPHRYTAQPVEKQLHHRTEGQLKRPRAPPKRSRLPEAFANHTSK
jgi:hypothetical protein